MQKASNTSWNVKELDIYHHRNGSWLCFALKIKLKILFIYTWKKRKKKRPSRGVNKPLLDSLVYTFWLIFSPTVLFVYVLLPLSFRELSLRSL